MKKIKVPEHLKEEGSLFWDGVLSDYDLEEKHHLKLLEKSCECLDGIAQDQRHQRKHGCYIKDRFGQWKENPSRQSERNLKVLFARLMRELGLDLEPPKENRPPEI